MMTRKEALGEMLNGHKVIHPDVDGVFEYIDGDISFGTMGFIRKLPQDKGFSIVKATMCMDDGYDWYVEPVAPPKRIKMWQWVIRPTDRRPRTTDNYYRSLGDVTASYGTTAEIIKCADWTEIEVDE